MKLRSILYVLGLVVIAASVQTATSAFVPAAVPEIDGGSALTALGLLSGGLMVLRARYGQR